MRRFIHPLLVLLALVMLHTGSTAAEKLSPYTARFERARPVVAVVGDNTRTVLPDFVLPYGIMAQSGAVDVVSVATNAAPMHLEPLTFIPDQSLEQFNQRYPDGADYVFVPAMGNRGDVPESMKAWLRSQSSKGATLISICNGSLVLARAGLLRGLRATGHFSTYKERKEKFPDTRWIANARYVVDGRVMTSSGITAAIPASLAVLEAIVGSERTTEVARKLGVEEWGNQHNSDAFEITMSDKATFVSNSMFSRKQEIGIPVAQGVDEMALSLLTEAYSVTQRAKPVTVAASGGTLRTRSGLQLVPDRVKGAGKAVDLMLPELEPSPLAKLPGKYIEEIKTKYGDATARWVMLDFEYLP